MTADFATVQVLIVDDNRQMRRLLRDVLWSLGLRRVLEAGDAFEALDAMRSTPVDLVLLDWMMQPMDGLECARLLRSATDSPNPFCSIIMVSGHANKARVREARDAGVNSFLVKPVSAQSVREHVMAALTDTRPFICSHSYIGPDRRRYHDVDFKGPFRREEDRMREEALSKKNR